MSVAAIRLSRSRLGPCTCRRLASWCGLIHRFLPSVLTRVTVLALSVPTSFLFCILAGYRSVVLGLIRDFGEIA